MYLRKLSLFGHFFAEDNGETKLTQMGGHFVQYWCHHIKPRFPYAILLVYECCVGLMINISQKGLPFWTNWEIQVLSHYFSFLVWSWFFKSLKLYVKFSFPPLSFGYRSSPRVSARDPSSLLSVLSPSHASRRAYVLVPALTHTRNFLLCMYILIIWC